MDAVVVRDNHQSFTQTFQGPCLRHVQSSPRPVPVPVPVPGTDAYPRTRGRVEGEPYDSVQDALLLSLPSSRSTSISEYSMPVDSVASLSSFHPASFGITKLDTVVSRSTPPPPAFVPPPRRSPTSLSRSSSQKLTSPVHQHSLPPVSKSHETLRPTSLPTSLPSFSTTPRFVSAPAGYDPGLRSTVTASSATGRLDAGRLRGFGHKIPGTRFDASQKIHRVDTPTQDQRPG
ncbi:hypothetical protein CEP52_004687 [Fusarium oligoseptatum]|uniref:Uncharacterized protein n=1 Tax=Fusarium oligoseptatum TaxID=2604345 RepID=A0A428U2D7_9HYPO|nr:hypothetical protein CEP52_004687 [Fusarium oligoseptatum]